MDFARHLSNRYGIAADVSIHDPGRNGDNRNHHAHILTTTRIVTPEGFGAKTRALDDKKTGEVDHVRATWAELTNQALERAGHNTRVSHKSLEAQGIDRKPTSHLGPGATAMERRGVASDRGELNRVAQVNQTEREELGLQEKVRAGLERRRMERQQYKNEKAQALAKAAAAEKKKKEELERKERERLTAQKIEQERTRMAQERLRTLAEGKEWLATSKDPETAFEGFYKAWLEKQPREEGVQSRQGDWVVSCRMLSAGYEPEKLEEILCRRSPTIPLLDGKGEDYARRMVEKALQSPEVQEQRAKALARREKEKERQRSRGPSMGR